MFLVFFFLTEALVFAILFVSFLQYGNHVQAGAEKKEGHVVPLFGENGVRYTVPQTLDTENMNDKITVRFRVADVYKDRYISVYYDGKRVAHRKKKVLAPGEMEQVIITKDSLKDCPDLEKIVICTEEE